LAPGPLAPPARLACAAAGDFAQAQQFAGEGNDDAFARRGGRAFAGARHGVAFLVEDGLHIGQGQRGGIIAQVDNLRRDVHLHALDSRPPAQRGYDGLFAVGAGHIRDFQNDIRHDWFAPY
jgi:hypothetical protein